VPEIPNIYEGPEIIRVTLAEQLAFFDRKAERAWVRSQRDSKTHRERRTALARERMIRGFAQYGDLSWHKTYAELEQDESDEDADKLVYRVIKMFRGWY